jgi:hypothetical protein
LCTFELSVISAIAIAPVVTLLVRDLVPFSILLLVGSFIAEAGVVTTVRMLVSKSVLHCAALQAIVAPVGATIAESRLVTRSPIAPVLIMSLTVPIMSITVPIMSLTVPIDASTVRAAFIASVVTHLVSASISIVVRVHSILVSSAIGSIILPVGPPTLIVLVVLNVSVFIVISVFVVPSAVLQAFLRLICSQGRRR